MFQFFCKNLGVVPRLCEETFNRIAKVKADAENKIEYEVTRLHVFISVFFYI